MPRPYITSWVKEWNDLLGKGIDSGEIRPLVEIAAMAGQSQIVRVVRSAMLFSNYMFDVVGEVAVLLT